MKHVIRCAVGLACAGEDRRRQCRQRGAGAIRPRAQRPLLPSHPQAHELASLRAALSHASEERDALQAECLGLGQQLSALQVGAGMGDGGECRRAWLVGRWVRGWGTLRCGRAGRGAGRGAEHAAGWGWGARWAALQMARGGAEAICQWRGVGKGPKHAAGGGTGLAGTSLGAAGGLKVQTAQRRHTQDAAYRCTVLTSLHDTSTRPLPDAICMQAAAAGMEAELEAAERCEGLWERGGIGAARSGRPQRRRFLTQSTPVSNSSWYHSLNTFNLPSRTEPWRRTRLPARRQRRRQRRPDAAPPRPQALQRSRRRERRRWGSSWRRWTGRTPGR